MRRCRRRPPTQPADSKAPRPTVPLRLPHPTRAPTTSLRPRMTRRHQSRSVEELRAARRWGTHPKGSRRGEPRPRRPPRLPRNPGSLRRRRLPRLNRRIPLPPARRRARHRRRPRPNRGASRRRHRPPLLELGAPRPPIPARPKRRAGEHRALPGLRGRRRPWPGVRPVPPPRLCQPARLTPPASAPPPDGSATVPAGAAARASSSPAPCWRKVSELPTWSRASSRVPKQRLCSQTGG